jgi:hypothetical protein
MLIISMNAAYAYYDRERAKCGVNGGGGRGGGGGGGSGAKKKKAYNFEEKIE